MPCFSAVGSEAENLPHQCKVFVSSALDVTVRTLGKHAIQ